MLAISLFLFFISFLPPLYLFITSKNIPHAKPKVENTMNSKITLLLPVRNEIKNIERKLIELLSLFQEIDTKIIIIDSNSQDSTPEKAKEILSDSNTNIEWEIINTELLGKSKAINYVLESINTQWFIMFDADASVSKESIDLILDWLQDPSCGAVCGSQKINIKNSSYRSRFNTIRIAETFHDSATVFEGSLCAIRVEALKGEKLIENINADDTQFAHMVKKNGYRAIFESKAYFTDNEPLNFKYSLRRNIRRSQGLIRALWHNKDLISLKTKFGRYYAHSFYFYIFFPWLVIFFSSLLIYDSYPIFSSNLQTLLIFIFSILLSFTFFNSLFSSFINGIFSIIFAQISLIFGIKYNSWLPHRK